MWATKSVSHWELVLFILRARYSKRFPSPFVEKFFSYPLTRFICRRSRDLLTCDQASLIFLVAAGRYAYLSAATKNIRDAWSQVRDLLKFRGVILIFPFNQSRLPSTSRDVGKPLDHLIDVLEVSAHLTFHFAFFSGFWRHLLVLRWLKLIIFTLDETWITLFVPIWHS